MSQTLDEKITILGDLYEGAKNCVHTLTPLPPAGAIEHEAHVRLYDLLVQMRDMCAVSLKAHEASAAAAKKYAELEEKISSFYPADDEGNETDGEGGDLLDIGEAAASHFGFI